MNELAFNLFYFVVGNVIQEVGAVAHPLDCTEQEMSAKLRAAVPVDVVTARRFPIPQANTGITVERYNAMERLGRQLEIYEPAFQAMNASQFPLLCVTAVVDGHVQIDAVSDKFTLRMEPFQGHAKVGLGYLPDYLSDYMTPAGLDIPQLLNDDHFQAIRLLYNHKSFLACMKLIASFIDTVAFLEHGDTQGNFVRWLDAYAKIPTLGITSAQLWELRNSLVHMSNLDSRKVLSGREARISFFIGRRGMPSQQDENMVYFNLSDLIVVLGQALTAWTETFARQPSRMVDFVQRYDRIVREGHPRSDIPSAAP